MIDNGSRLCNQPIDQNDNADDGDQCEKPIESNARSN
jgi:hypothetical protein